MERSLAAGCGKVSVAPHDPERTKRLVVRSLIVLVVALVVVNVVAYLLDRAGGARRGPQSSSYTTSGEGLAAYADLLARAGHPVARLRAPLAEAGPNPRTTLVLLDPGPVVPSEARALDEFVTDGGRLIVGGPTAAAWVADVVADEPRWAVGGPESSTVAAPTPEVAGVDGVRTSGVGQWSDPASGLPVLAGDDGVVATVESVEDGRVVMLADSAILHNELLAFAGNAAFGLQAAGETGRPVMFAESVHGYAGAGGLAAIPDRWLWALTGLLLATFVLMLAKGRRLGPPEEPGRPLPPPRRDYADALGGILARTREASTVADRLRTAIRHRVAARAGLGAGATGEEVGRAAQSLGLSQRQLGALERPDASEEDLVVLGRALAELESRKRRNEEIGAGL